MVLPPARSSPQHQFWDLEHPVGREARDEAKRAAFPHRSFITMRQTEGGRQEGRQTAVELIMSKCRRTGDERGSATEVNLSLRISLFPISKVILLSRPFIARRLFASANHSHAIFMASERFYRVQIQMLFHITVDSAYEFSSIVPRKLVIQVK